MYQEVEQFVALLARLTLGGALILPQSCNVRDPAGDDLRMIMLLLPRKMYLEVGKGNRRRLLCCSGDILRDEETEDMMASCLLNEDE